MDRIEAKLLLQSYRPGGQDALDPAFAEALALAQKDPELAEWLKDQCELDEAISRRVREAPVPADLRQAILAGQRSHRHQTDRPQVWWKSPALAWAAAIALVFVAAVFFRGGSGSPVALAAYRNAMTAHLRSGFDFDLQDSQPHHIQQWLAQNGRLADVQFPESLDRAIGCKLFQFENMQAALVCFTLPDKEVVHLFVVDGSRFKADDFAFPACSSRCNEYNTVAWRNQRRVYLLAGHIGQPRLREIAGQLEGVPPAGPIR
jgi:hypothetical protein